MKPRVLVSAALVTLVSSTAACGGSGGEHTLALSVWFGQVMNPEGTASLNDQPPMTNVFNIYKDLYAKGITGATAKEEQGPTWTGFFPKGGIGVMPMPSTTLGGMPKDMNIGVAPIAGPDGGESTFVGGDSVGIGDASKLPELNTEINGSLQQS